MILALNKFYKGGPPKDKAIAMVEVISELARDAGVNVFRRFAFMKGLYQGRAGLIRPVGNPTDDSRLHDNDWSGWRGLAIVGGVDKARSSVAANIS